MICKHCKAENEDGALFCSNCGKPLEDEEYDREKMRGNTKLYIGISIALMIFLASGLVFGFFYFSNKVQKANDERNTIASESDVAANYFRSQIREQEDAITELQSQIDLLKASITDYQNKEEDQVTSLLVALSGTTRTSSTVYDSPTVMDFLPPTIVIVDTLTSFGRFSMSSLYPHVLQT